MKNSECGANVSIHHDPWRGGRKCCGGTGRFYEMKVWGKCNSYRRALGMSDGYVVLGSFADQVRFSKTLSKGTRHPINNGRMIAACVHSMDTFHVL